MSNGMGMSQFAFKGTASYSYKAIPKIILSHVRHAQRIFSHLRACPKYFFASKGMPKVYFGHALRCENIILGMPL
jgi:hypothetical protein